MLQIGFLPVFARLIGSTSAVTGLIVQVVVADLIGASYGLLFRRQSYDIGSALGWESPMASSGGCSDRSR